MLTPWKQWIKVEFQVGDRQVREIIYAQGAFPWLLTYDPLICVS